MRAELLYESAVDELKKKLPSLRKIDYSTIDNLMQRISKRYKITGKKLHDLFVSKYGHSPDTWIKKYKEKLGEEGVAEGAGETLQQQKIRAAISNGLAKSSQMGKTEYQSQPTNRTYFDNAGYASDKLTGIDSIDPDGTVVISIGDTRAADWVKKLAALGGMPGIKTREVQPKLAQGVAEEKQRLDPHCWDNKKIGNPKTKMKGGTRVNNCVPAESVEEDWNKVNKKDKTSGMSQKAVNAYRRENPGSKLKTAVTTKPSKLKPGSKAANRRKSFCARMGGNKGPMKKPNGKPTPKALALRRWNCESIEQLEELVMLAEQKINEAKNLKQQAAIAISKKKGMNEGVVYDFKGWAAGTNSHLRESVEGKDDVQRIKDFINWSLKTLNIEKPYPKFILSKNTDKAQKGHHTGMHTGDRIWVYIENRNLVDIFRTIFHELVHHRQDQLGMIKHGDSYPGSPIEALADMMAGKYMKIYGQEHPDIFQ